MSESSSFYLRFLNFPFGNVFNGIVSSGTAVSGDYQAVYKAVSRSAHSYDTALAMHMCSVDYLYMKEILCNCLPLTIDPLNIGVGQFEGECIPTPYAPSNMFQLKSKFFGEYGNWWDYYGKHAIILELIEEGTHLSAGCIVCQYNPQVSNDTLNIDTLYVKPEYRGQGGFKMMLNYVSTTLRTVLANFKVIPSPNTLKYITIHASIKNGDVVDKYRHYGFNAVGQDYMCFMNVDDYPVDTYWKGGSPQADAAREQMNEIEKHRKQFTKKDKVFYKFDYEPGVAIGGMPARLGQKFIAVRGHYPSTFAAQYFNSSAGGGVDRVTLSYRPAGKEDLISMCQFGITRSPGYSGVMHMKCCHDKAALHKPSQIPGMYGLFKNFINENIGANLITTSLLIDDTYGIELLKKFGFVPHQLRMFKAI